MKKKASKTETAAPNPDCRWIVTAVDTSETADGKPRVLKVCKTEKEAKAFVKKDIEAYENDAGGMELVVSVGRMTAHTKDYRYGCEWNVERVEI